MFGKVDQDYQAPQHRPALPIGTRRGDPTSRGCPTLVSGASPEGPGSMIAYERECAAAAIQGAANGDLTSLRRPARMMIWAASSPQL